MASLHVPFRSVWSVVSKKAAGAARKSASATGGGPSVAPTLSQVELKILSIMGEGFGEPETGARVPAFPLLPPVRDPEPVATSPTHAATPADTLPEVSFYIHGGTGMCLSGLLVE